MRPITRSLVLIATTALILFVAEPRTIAQPRLVVLEDGHKSPIRRLALSPDASRVISVGDDQTLRVWDIASASNIATYHFSPYGSIDGFDLSLDGEECIVHLATGKKGLLLRLKIRTGQILSADYGVDLNSIASPFTTKNIDFRNVFYSSVQNHLIVQNSMPLYDLSANRAVSLDKQLPFERAPGIIVSPNRQHVILTNNSFVADKASCAFYMLDLSKKTWLHLGDTGSAGLIQGVVANDGKHMYGFFCEKGESDTLAKYTTSGVLVKRWTAADLIRRLDVRQKTTRLQINGICSIGNGDSCLVLWAAAGTSIQPVETGVAHIHLLKDEFEDIIRGNGEAYDVFAASSDQSRIAIANSLDQSLRVFDVKTKKTIVVFPGVFQTLRQIGITQDDTFLSIETMRNGSNRSTVLDLNRSVIHNPSDGSQNFRSNVTSENGFELKKETLRWGVYKEGKRINQPSQLFMAANPMTIIPGLNRAVAASSNTRLDGVERLVAFDLNDPNNQSGKTNYKVESSGHLKVTALTPAHDAKKLFVGMSNGVIHIYPCQLFIKGAMESPPLLSYYTRNADWIAWTPQGYYAASPGGEQLMGWLTDNGPDKLATFHPAERFRKSLYRPDIISRVLKLGSVEAAVKEADAEAVKHSISRPVVSDIAAVLPPKVRISTPGEPIVVHEGDGPFVVKALATPTDGRKVGAFRLLVDNRVNEAMTGTPRGGAVKDGVVEQSWDVKFLSEGEYRIKVQAESEVSTGESGSIIVQYRPKAKLSAKPKMWVLGIGINKYKDAPLKCCVNDAEALCNAFKDFAAPLYDVVTDIAKDEEATLDGIRRRLEKIKDEAKKHPHKDNAIVLLFAGHGHNINKQLFLQPFNGDPSKPETCLSGAELANMVTGMPCQRRLVLLDACHAGVSADELVRLLASEGTGIQVMCGSSANEKALENNGQGYFTRAVVTALKGEKVYIDEDGVVYSTAITDRVAAYVRELSDGKQTPTLIIRDRFALTKPPIEKK